MFYVYEFCNKENGKKYIGKTNDIDKRKYQHAYLSLQSKNVKLFHRAIAKYGIDCFSFSILFSNDDEIIVLEKEKFFIELYKTNVSKYGKDAGYNLTDGGEGVSGLKMSEASKLKMSERKMKFSDPDITNILNDYKTGEHTTTSLSVKYNCSPPTISNVINNKTTYKIDYDFSIFDSIKNDNKHPSGENNQYSSFTNEQVISILNEYKSGGISTRKLAIKYNCHATTIENMINGKCYPDLDYDRTILQNVKIDNYANKSKNNCGEQNVSSKLSEKDILTIKKLCADGMQVKEVAKLFGIHKQTVGKIKNNQTWKHLSK